MIKQLKIDNVDYTQFVSLPVTEQYALDESLDNGVLVLKYTKIDTVFKPYSKVLFIYEDNQQTTYYVAQDEVTKIIGGNYYNHRLTLIEETKILEKIVVDTNTITQPLIHNYFGGNSEAYITATPIVEGFEQAKYYYETIFADSIVKYIANDTYSFSGVRQIMQYTENTNVTDAYYNGLTNLYRWSFTLHDEMTNEDVYVSQGTSDNDYEWTDTVDVNMGTLATEMQNGHLYKITYYARFQRFGLFLQEITKSFSFYVWENEIELTDYSITDVVNRLLAISETLKAGLIPETPRYTFNIEQATEYSKIKSPEFSFTRSTLKECLDQVGGYIHAIPRLENDVIYFDKLGQMNDNGLPTPTYSYYINYEPDVSGNLDVHINFIVNDTQYTNISTHGGDLWYDEEAVYSIFGAVGTRWKHENSPYTDLDYRKIEFLERPTGDLLTWLENNAERERQPAQMPLNCIGEIKSQNIEQYCTNIDTNADNLVNLENSKTGTIIEPYMNGYETVRAETGVVRIADDTAIIETEYPIERIAQLKIGYTVDNSSNPVDPVDITPYVYESVEYQALSSYDGTFPFAKAYGIYYKLGERNIYGLNFKIDNPISPIFSHYAIINILEKATGNDYSNLAYIKPFVQLNFQIVYYPIVSARVGQSKTDLREYNKKITSIYNQSANMLDSTAYGENLKGAVMRLGNVDIKKTYLFPSYDYIYPVGTLVDDDYYISTVEIGHYKNYIKCTYGLSKDFNRLSQYIGIKNNIRMYEISERQAVDRYILSEDYIVLGDDASSADNKALICSDQTLLGFTNEIQGGLQQIEYPTVAICQTDALNTKFALPLVSLGIGNSILFTFKFQDNYSAGNVATPGSDNDTFNVQTYAPYGNILGRFKDINIKLETNAQIPTDQASAVTIGNALPVVNGSYTETEFTNYDLQVYKDNRERLIFNHQVHFVTNWDKFIISSNLASYNYLIGADIGSAWKLYILPNKINKFEKDIDLTGATLVSSDIAFDYNMVYDALNWSKIKFNDNATATASGKAWAVMKEVNSENKLLFGRNIDIIENEEIELPTISFVHKIFN